MIVGALDLSLTKIGWAKTRSGGDGSRSGVFHLSGRGAGRLEQGLRKCVSAMRGCDLVVLEGYSYGSADLGVSYAHSQGEMGGVVRLGLWQMKPRPAIAVVPPASLKMFATGNGRASKQAMMLAARKSLGWLGSRDDEADALWLHQMALHRYQLPGTVPLAHGRSNEALDGCEWPSIASPADLPF